jgi:hypothetical protein
MAGVIEMYKTRNQLRLPQGLTRFAYYTGWRKGKILTLEWRAMHEDVIRLRPEIAQDKDSRVIILVGEMANLIDWRRAERVKFHFYVFHRQGQPSKAYSRA